jgi:FdhD protein
MLAESAGAMSEEPLDHEADVVRWDAGKIQRVSDELSVEEPLEIRVRGRAISVTMRTPGHDEELAAGFLLSEGIVKRAGDVLKVEPCGRNEFGNVVNALLAPEVHVDFERLTRHVFASSSCGLCGKATIEAVCSRLSTLVSRDDGFTIDPNVITTMPQTMRAAQETFTRTGGLHAAALFDACGKLIVLREDIGRHNAVDKVIGHALMKQLLPLTRHVLLVSGRASFEIVQKALAAQIPIVAAVSAPSSLAVSFAKDAGMTLIGFLRDQRMNIYSHPQRLGHAGCEL